MGLNQQKKSPISDLSFENWQFLLITANNFFVPFGLQISNFESRKRPQFIKRSRLCLFFTPVSAS